SIRRASTVYSANPKRSEGSVPGLKAPTNGWLISPDLNEVRVQHLTCFRTISANASEVSVGTHKRSCPDLKH
ncbi:MAG: hypothetical protein ABSF90_30560, partial [Syntrophobacteraceae bacterium]